ncbi:MAG: gluconokinase [Citrobacter freundii]|nr:MAG: gluconokinase [Citrobacter freundii]
MKCIITIELGTNAVRIFAFDLNGTIIGSMKGYYPTFYSQPDYSEQDPEQIFITMLYVLKNLLNETIHPKRYKVASICFSSYMHSLLTVDRNGVPLGNAITWSDNRAKKEASEIRASALGNEMYDKTGTPLHPMSPLLKIAWLRKNDPNKFSQAGKFLSIKSYVLHQLTGEYVIDYSLACATGMLNIHKIAWEKIALEYAGISAEQLPQLVPVFAEAGSLKKAYQNSLGLGSDTKILTGSSDGCMATLGAGIWNTDKATVTIEDSSAVRVVGGKMLHDEKRRVFNYLITENCFVSGGPSNSGGAVFEWFAKQFGDFPTAYDVESSMNSMFEEATKVNTGSEGLLFLPYLLGERAPIWNPDARGMYFGINIKHEKQHFIRATIEGIIYEIYSIGKMLKEHRNIKGLSINGSFATNPFCAQLIADMFNEPVHTLANPNSVGTGAFLLAATEMGIFKSLDEAAGQTGTGKTYMPLENNHTVYMKYFEIFERLSVKLGDEFEKIAELQ